MGHLLGAVTQGVLDNQRSVVQNEKRQGDSRPGGLVQYELFGNLFPPGHPYHHTTIGSMADLDAASLADVKQWFRDKYGPNNAVLVIAGRRHRGAGEAAGREIFRDDPARAGQPSGDGRACRRWPRPKTDRDEGPASRPRSSSATGRCPGLLDKQLAALDIGGSVLGGLASSRLDRILVRDEKIAVAVSAQLTPLQRAGIFSVSAYVRPGVDPAVVSKRLDAGHRRLYRQGPDRGRGPARGDERSLGPNPRARAGRRLRRQGGRRSPKGRRYAARQRLLQEDARILCRDHAGGGARGDAAMAAAAGADASSSRPASARAYAKSKSTAMQSRRRKQERRSAQGQRGSSRRSASSPRSTSRRSAMSAWRTESRSNTSSATAVPVTQVALAFDAGDAADSPRCARARGDDHGPARRRHDDAEPRSRSPRPRSGSAPMSAPATAADRSLRRAERAFAEPRAVARPAGRRRQGRRRSGRPTSTASGRRR